MALTSMILASGWSSFPVFGIAIPLITGMINPYNFSNWQIKLSFLFTIGIAAVIWQGNRYLHYSHAQLF